MSDWIKQVFENKVISQLIVVLVVGMFAFYVGSVKSESDVNSELKIVNIRLKAMEGEIALIKIKQDQISTSKADKNTIDISLNSMNIKLDRYNTETNARLDRILELIINK